MFRMVSFIPIWVKGWKVKSRWSRVLRYIHQAWNKLYTYHYRFLTFLKCYDSYYLVVVVVVVVVVSFWADKELFSSWVRTLSFLNLQRLWVHPWSSSYAGCLMLLAETDCSLHRAIDLEAKPEQESVWGETKAKEQNGALILDTFVSYTGTKIWWINPF